MRHRVEGRSLGRRTEHRAALLQNLVAQLIKHERITTTEAKAREARKLAERVITKGRGGSVHERRLAMALLTDKHAVSKLFDELGPRYAERPGGYTRMLKLGPRKGDSAAMALLELV
ncbi:MAG: 50S ribosomal protein L17 [Dehalococcoidia bacterium]